jgi:hypothetical protein
MRCSDFLASYSDFRDGLIDDPATERRMAAHLLSCPQCTRYDARVARGVTLLRTFTDLDPSPQFRRRLRRCTAKPPLRLEQSVRPAPAGIMAGLMVATAIVLLVWSVRTTDAPAPMTRAATESMPPAPPPLPSIVAIPSPPFVSFTELSAPSFRAEWRTPGARDDALVHWTASSH